MRVAPRGRRSLVAIAASLAAALLLLAPQQAAAGEERYDYDALGRLVRVIDEQGRVTEYVYDAAGNILQVIVSGAGSAQPPAVTAFSPASIRRGETTSVQITGTGLTGAQLSTPDPGLDISALQVGASQVSFTLAASAAAALGAHTISISNAGGTASVQLTVDPVLPKLNMSPLPIAVPPSGTGRNFFVTLSNPDNREHVVSLVSSNPARVTVSPASVTFAAGQTEKLVTVTGHTAGNAAINLSSPLLAPNSVPVFVTAEFAGITSSLAPLLGVVRTPGPAAPTSTTFTPIATPALGVARGAYISAIEPNHFTVGTGPVTLVVRGAELGGVTAVAVSPPDGVTLGPVSVAPDGTSVSVPVSVAADAPTTLRRVVLSGAQQPYRAARPEAEHIRITTPAPRVDSVDPIFAVAGTAAMTLTVRGRNFQTVQAVSITPSSGISVSSTPSVSADGGTITLAVSVSAAALPGPRVVTVTTIAGTSDATATPSNTFSVVNEVEAAFTPIVAPILGVVLQPAAQPQPQQTFSAFSTLLGVIVPPGIAGMSPAVGIIGQNLTLTITGAGLGGVTAVQAVPSDGLTLGAPSVNADGTSVTVAVDVALTAPQTLRTIRVLAGTTAIAFANPGAALFRVTAPLPEITGLSQIYLQAGAPAVPVTIYGRNFQNASAVRVEPAAGFTVSPPTINADATQATVSVSAAAGAATGPRTVIIATPAGESAATAAPANTINVVNTIEASFTPILASPVGVFLQSVAPPVSTTFGPIVSPIVGVVLQADASPPSANQFFAFAGALGVAVGPFATGVQAPPLTPDVSALLTISGAGLADATAVQISPPDGITVGALSPAPDGSRIQVPITLSGAAAVPRTVLVLRGAQRVSFVPAASDVIRIATGAPHIDSISPILAGRGETVVMTIRGQHLRGVTGVTATPGSGIFIDSQPVVNAGGDIVLQISIAEDAPLGSSVFRVFTFGGASTEAAEPANTFTVLE